MILSSPLFSSHLCVSYVPANVMENLSDDTFFALNCFSAPTQVVKALLANR